MKINGKIISVKRLIQEIKNTANSQQIMDLDDLITDLYMDLPEIKAPSESVNSYQKAQLEFLLNTASFESTKNLKFKCGDGSNETNTI